jgi:DNA-3-methyladenine glycosylase I
VRRRCVQVPFASLADSSEVRYNSDFTSNKSQDLAVGALMGGLEGHPEGTRTLQDPFFSPLLGDFVARQRRKEEIFGGFSPLPNPHRLSLYDHYREELRMTSEHEHYRCEWVGNDPLMQAYHDQEWGVPEREGRALWEKLILDGFQAGLSWSTILRKRAAFRRAFQGFDPQIVAQYGAEDIARLLADPGIVRSRAKIEATIGNARAYIAMAEAGEDFSTFIWAMAGGAPIRNTWQGMGDIPAKTPLSEAISVALKKRGFKFVGPVIVYAWMQATGIVNDHVVGCFRRETLQ